MKTNRLVGCADNIQELEKLMYENRIFLANMLVAHSAEKYYLEEYEDADKIYYIESVNRFILLHPDFYNSNKKEIQELFYKIGKQDNIDSLDEIKELIETKKYDSYTIFIDKYRYDEDYIREIISLAQYQMKLTIQFYDIKPSPQLMFSLRKEKAHAQYIDKKGNITELSKDWLTSNFILDMKAGDALYKKIPYLRLKNSLDSIDELCELDCIRITNIEESKPSYKSETNLLYLKDVIKIASYIRDSGYTKPIVIYCDSANDVSNILSFSDNKGILFSYMMQNGFDVLSSGEENITTCRNNNAFFKRRAQEILEEKDLDLYDKLKEIFLVIGNVLSKISSNTDSKAKVLFGHFYDMCKFLGLNPIKCNSPECYYFYEPHNPKVVKIRPNFIYNYLDSKGNNLLDLKDNDELFKKVLELSNRDVEELKVYNDYLNAESIDEIKMLFLNRIDLNNPELNYREAKPYLEELKYLISILMDISEDDYLEFRNYYSNITTYSEVLDAIEYIGNIIITNKRKQIGITMTINKNIVRR